MSARCVIGGCDGEEDPPPKFGRITIALPDQNVLVPLCPEHYGAIIAANAQRNAWMAEADRPDDQETR